MDDGSILMVKGAREPELQPEPQETSMRSLSWLKDYGLGLGALCYLAGYSVTAFYLAQFSVSDVDLFRSRYVLTGALFLVFYAAVVDGAARAWRLADRLGYASAENVGGALAGYALRVVALVVVPFAVLVYLPAVLEDADKGERWFRLPAAGIDFPHLAAPWATLLRPFVLGWLVPFAVALALGLLLWCGARVGVPGCARARAATRYEAIERMIPTAPTVVARSRTAPERPFGFWAVAVTLLIASLIIYALSVYGNIPHQYGGGEPRQVYGVYPPLATTVPGVYADSRIYLIARTSDSVVLQAYPAQEGKGDASFTFEVDKDKIASLVYEPPDQQVEEEGDPPSNDDFEHPKSIPEGAVPGTTARATRENFEPDHYTIGPGNDPERWIGDHSVWYSWEAPADGYVVVDTCAANIDSVLAVYVGNTISNLVRVADNNNGCPIGWGSKVQFKAQHDKVYKIAVADVGGAREDSFTLAIGQFTGSMVPPVVSPIASPVAGS